jgi:hypothetical protein
LSDAIAAETAPRAMQTTMVTADRLIGFLAVSKAEGMNPLSYIEGTFFL